MVEAIEGYVEDIKEGFFKSVMRRWGDSIKLTLARLALLLVLLVFWELASYTIINPFWVSRPSLIAIRLVQSLAGGELLRHTYTTFIEIVLGFLIGGFSGVVAGFLFGYFRFGAKILDPFIMALYGIPKVVIAPLLILWFGIGMGSKIVLVIIMVWFVAFFNTFSGVKNVDKELLNIIRALGASERQLVIKVIFPASTPFILTGLKVSVPFAIIGAIVAEFVASTKGLGYMIANASGLLDTTGVFAGIIAITIFVLILNSVVDAAESHMLRWRGKD